MKVVNKKAKFDYEILEEWEVGIQLTGAEVKSAKKGAVSLMGSRVLIRDGEVFVVGMQISPYENAGGQDHDPNRTRKLLLRKAEIDEIVGKIEQKGLTVVPLSMYNKGEFIKLRIGLVRGKKTHEKREILRKRAHQKKIQLALKRKLN